MSVAREDHTSPFEMSCERVRALLNASESLKGLDYDRTTDLIAEHIEGCQFCSRYLACLEGESVPPADTTDRRDGARILADAICGSFRGTDRPKLGEPAVLLFPLEKVDRPIINQLHEPCILEAKTNAVYAYTLVKCEFRSQDYDLFRSEGVDVLTKTEFRNWCRRHPIDSDGATPLLERYHNEEFDIHGFRYSTDDLEKAILWMLTKQVPGVQFNVYHAQIIGSHAYLEVALMGSSEDKKAFCAAAKVLGMEHYAPPRDGRTLWCQQLRDDVRDALRRMMPRRPAMAIEALVHGIERCYPRFPCRATSWYWVDKAEFEVDLEEQLEARMREADSGLGQTEFARTLEEFTLLETTLIEVSAGRFFEEVRSRLSDDLKCAIAEK